MSKTTWRSQNGRRNEAQPRGVKTHHSQTESHSTSTTLGQQHVKRLIITNSCSMRANKQSILAVSK